MEISHDVMSANDQAQRPLATVMLGGKENMEQPESSDAEKRASGSLERVVSQQRGFWRSPRGENHGLNSKPGDEWAREGDIHDTDRLRWIVLNFDEDDFFNMPEDFGVAREYIDALMLANI